MCELFINKLGAGGDDDKEDLKTYVGAGWDLKLILMINNNKIL